MCARRVISALVFSVLFFVCNCLNAAGQEKKVTLSRQPGSITLNAPTAIHSMDPGNTIYSSIQIANGTVSALSTQPASSPTITLPAGAAIYPGFIDSHSHAISLLLAQSTDPSGDPYWISLANVNVMLLQDCSTPTPGSTTCFTPIKTQGEVNSLLKNAKPPNGVNWVLGWNYEPSRLVCKINDSETYGPLCPNFENQNTATALQQLDKLQPTTPLLVTSESGHIVYVNSAALKLLNICNVSAGSTSSCYKPTVNTVEETKLARTGQLDEDIAIYAIGFAEGQLAQNYGGTSKEKQLEFYSKQIETSLDLYSQIGYTTVQEGAASSGVIGIYMATAAAMAVKSEYLPVTMAFLEYDGTTANDFGSSVATAQKLQGELSSGGYDMFIAGMKAFADGSNQGFTGDMSVPPPVQYENLSKPFLNPNIFKQPYDGLPDYDQQGLTTAMNAAHKGGFPLWVHTNGSQAQTNVLKAMEAYTSAVLRDVVIHFTMPTQPQVNSVLPDRIGVTFLMNNFYYYYQPLCELILGTAATQNLYPALWAQQHKLHYGLHSDASVTPPSPLFSMWVASTRNYQQGNWLPKISPACQAAVKTAQKISRLEAVRAYTSEAAWLYHREATTGQQPGIGSLQQGFAGDLVVLSADPLGPNTDLSKIYVLYTIHNGNIVYPASGKGPGTGPPVWPK